MIYERFIFMKVGWRAHESLGDIIERKQREIADAGLSLWGYGGSACHPTSQVQPFCTKYFDSESPWRLLMQKTKSVSNPDIQQSKEYSIDSACWNTIPNGIRVTGSKHAFVLSSIKKVDIHILLEDYCVAVGPSKGKCARSYIYGRTDKACLQRKGLLAERPGRAILTKIDYEAEITSPYSVFLR